MRDIGTVMYPGGTETAKIYIDSAGKVYILGVFEGLPCAESY